MTRYLIEHARAMAALDKRVEVLVPESAGAWLIAERLAGVEGASVEAPGRLMRVDLWRRLRARRPAFVRLCTGKAPPDTRLAMSVALVGVPMVESLHLPTSRRVSMGRRLGYRLRRDGLYLCLNNTKMMDERLRAQVPGLAHRMVFEQEGVDLEAFEPGGGSEGTGPIRFVSVGRLDESQKDVGVLIEAAAVLRSRGLEFEVTVAGDGADRGSLEGRARELGVEDVVRFAGWTEDVPGVLRKHDVFVNATKFESFGRTNIEAAACGLPVIASRVIGCVESVEDGGNGLLVKPGDAGTLADAMERVAQDDALRERLGARGPAFAAQFSMRAHTERVLALARERLGVKV
jgi:glycosyltransferase involved in cell wall biosynthesis